MLFPFCCVLYYAGLFFSVHNLVLFSLHKRGLSWFDLQRRCPLPGYVTQNFRLFPPFFSPFLFIWWGETLPSFQNVGLALVEMASRVLDRGKVCCNIGSLLLWVSAYSRSWLRLSFFSPYSLFFLVLLNESSPTPPAFFLLAAISMASDVLLTPTNTPRSNLSSFSSAARSSN